MNSNKNFVLILPVVSVADDQLAAVQSLVEHLVVQYDGLVELVAIARDNYLERF